MSDKTLKIFGEIIHRDLNRIADRVRDIGINLGFGNLRGTNADDGVLNRSTLADRKGFDDSQE